MSLPRRIVGWLMAVVLTAGNSALAVQHEHGHGEDAAHHPAPSGQPAHGHWHGALSHRHGHSHPHRHVHRGAERSENADLDPASRRHVHLLFLGIELTWSLEGETPSDDSAPCVPDTHILGATPATAGPKVNTPVSACFACMADWLPAECNASSPKIAPPPVPIAFLCDVARHERTGVLLS